MKTWAFIFESPFCASEPIRTEIKYGDRRLLILGAESIEAACTLAKWAMEEKGCWLIELCGGFRPEGAQAIIAAVEGKIPVGYVDFFPEEYEKVVRMK